MATWSGVVTGLFWLSALATFWYLTPDRLSGWRRRWRNRRTRQAMILDRGALDALGDLLAEQHRQAASGMSAHADLGAPSRDAARRVAEHRGDIDYLKGDQ